MKPARSLVRQYVGFIAVFVTVLSIGAFTITTHVTRRGLEDLFRQRLEQAERVLVEYGRGRDLARRIELESVLGSPRFLAALETGDPATVGQAVPTHPMLGEADYLRVTDLRDRRVLFESADDDVARLLPFEDRVVEQLEIRHLAARNAILEVVTADVWANNGVRIGRLEIVRDEGAAVADDLRRLTGLDVLLVLDDHVVDRSQGAPVADEATWLPELLAAEARSVLRTRVAGDATLAVRLEEPVAGFRVVFLGSVDAAVSPIMHRIRWFLLALAGVGGVIATAAVATFTNRRVGRTVQRLVRHAERIAGGDLDFVIERGSSDELGYLAGELERMRGELLRGRQRVEEAHQARLGSERMAAVGQMATGIIHDFKTPMAVVQGTTDLIAMRDPGNERLAQQCATIQKQVERMVALARDVIEYSRGDSVLEPEVVEVAGYLARIRDLHDEPFRQAGLQLVVRQGPAAHVLIDPGRMQRVIDNLLGNARDVSGVGDRVWLDWECEGGQGRIRVRDDGPGIAPEIAQTLFEPFVTAGKKGGSGLGLAISRKIVEDHGAEIAVSSEPGRGTSFVVTLPSKLLVRPEDSRTREGAIS